LRGALRAQCAAMRALCAARHVYAFDVSFALFSLFSIITPSLPPQMLRSRRHVIIFAP